jgi:hypothetical protein
MIDRKIDIIGPQTFFSPLSDFSVPYFSVFPAFAPSRLRETFLMQSNYIT